MIVKINQTGEKNMGFRNDHILSLLVDFESKTPAEKQTIRNEVKLYKATEHVAEYIAQLPFTVNLTGGGKCRIEVAFVDSNGNFVLYVYFTTGSTEHPFKNPWTIVNPPLLFPDPSGDIDLDGTLYSENLLAVGKDIIQRMYDKVSA